MSLYVAPKQSIIDATNAQNSTSLTLSDVTFGVPNVAPSDVVTTTGKNSQVRLTGNGTTWSGSVVVNYDRLPLSDIITLTSGTLKVGALTTTIEVMNYLNYFYGMVLTSDDIQNEAVTLDGNGAGTVTLHATTTSLGWTGSVTLNLIKGDAIVDYAVVDTSLSGLNYPTNQSAKGQAPMVLYAYDFTSLKSTIDLLPAGTVFTDISGSGTQATFTGQVNSISGQTWYLSTVTNQLRNFYQAKVIYNGLNSAEFATNQDYKYVMMIQLSDGTGNNGTTGAYATGFIGVAYLHYNDPA